MNAHVVVPFDFVIRSHVITSILTHQSTAKFFGRLVALPMLTLVTCLQSGHLRSFALPVAFTRVSMLRRQSLHAVWPQPVMMRGTSFPSSSSSRCMYISKQIGHSCGIFGAASVVLVVSASR